MTLKTVKRNSRSREGAWIEIDASKLLSLQIIVAPARERGLKYVRAFPPLQGLSRSREGAWIEMLSL